MLVVTAALELYVVAVLNRAIDHLSIARERSNTLFRELQHRVANNLQFVAALLRLRKKTLDQDSPGAAALGAAQDRLEMLSRVHRRLNSPMAASQPAEPYLEALVADLIKASDVPHIRLMVTAEPVVLELEALMSVSLIVAELVTNSLKHAFPDGREGCISIDLRGCGHHCVLKVEDDGVGLPESSQRQKAGSLGQGILQKPGASAERQNRLRRRPWDHRENNLSNVSAGLALAGLPPSAPRQAGSARRAEMRTQRTPAL